MAMQAMELAVGPRRRSTATVRLQPCRNCGAAPERLASDDPEYPVHVVHQVPTCPARFETWQETEELALAAWEGSRARSTDMRRRMGG